PVFSPTPTPPFSSGRRVPSKAGRPTWKRPGGISRKVLQGLLDFRVGDAPAGQQSFAAALDDAGAGVLRCHQPPKADFMFGNFFHLVTFARFHESLQCAGPIAV